MMMMDKQDKELFNGMPSVRADEFIESFTEIFKDDNKKLEAINIYLNQKNLIKNMKY